ncbi:DUF1244 domain-containing protein [Alkalimarinus alittae]|uniref:DUF1244 domain-containing protein n=1 Tax=Alkalimarinus alittae TaxID=2961619 RepID=A0ABY6N2S6_9ALTE|nr:DUF1244 domain-containing protein [Alkalimarinus alittae]UZE96416.1 DUF1244 domain-containing protein [Alkalimarinus alittae]
MTESKTDLTTNEHETVTDIEAAVFRRLLKHLDERKDAQNIDLMNLAGFCRNCLSKWYMAEAEARGVDVDYDAARERVYGEPYADWKEKYQQEATAEQLDKFKDSHKH